MRFLIEKNILLVSLFLLSNFLNLFNDAVEIPEGQFLSIVPSQRVHSNCQLASLKEYAEKLAESPVTIKEDIATKFASKCGISIGRALKLFSLGFLFFSPTSAMAQIHRGPFGVAPDEQGRRQMVMCPAGGGGGELAQYLYHPSLLKVNDEENGHYLNGFTKNNEKEDMDKIGKNGESGVSKYDHDDDDGKMAPGVWPKRMYKILDIIGRVLEVDPLVEFADQLYTSTSVHGKIMEMGEEGEDDIGYGRRIVGLICDGHLCLEGEEENLPEYGVVPHSRKPAPENSELERALRPQLLRLARRIGKGRLWVDNPLPAHRNGFLIGYEFDQNMLPHQIELLKWHLGHFMRFCSFIFVQTSSEHPLLFKHVLHFKLTKNGQNSAPNGLDRARREQIVEIDEKMLPIRRRANNNDPMMEFEERKRKFVEPILDTLLRAFCLDCAAKGKKAGKALKMGNQFPKHMMRFARLNAAYGAENYYILGYNYRYLEPRDINPRKAGNALAYSNVPASIFWLDYPNCKTGKYEIPVYIDTETASWSRPYLERAFKMFTKKTVIEFVHVDKKPSNKFFVHVKTNHLDGMTSTSQVAGLSHENNRPDSAKQKKLDWRIFYYRAQSLWEFYTQNYMMDYNYMPLHEYNPKSAMYVSENIQELTSGVYYPNKPHAYDWANVNYYYGGQQSGRGFMIAQENLPNVCKQN